MIEYFNLVLKKLEPWLCETMELFGPQIMEVLQQYLWPMVRVSAFFLTAPFFGLAAVNLRVKIGLGWFSPGSYCPA